MPTPPPQRKVLRRHLRVRLTASYVLFFACVYSAVGVAVHEVLKGHQKREAYLILDKQWADLQQYLRIDHSVAVWRFDREDPAQAAEVGQLRSILLLADTHGRVLEISPEYRLLEPDNPEDIRNVLRHKGPVWRLRYSTEGNPYMVRAEVFVGADGLRYYAAIGRSLAIAHAVLKKFTWSYFAMLPFVLAAGSAFGWLLTGRVLLPLNELVAAAQRITGSNLSLRIPSRGAGDELDRLIETFNQMMDRLEDSFRQIKQFSTDVSHELRTPITAVRGQLEVALFTAQTPEQYREAIQSALEETERLSQLIQGMLVLSQAESGQTALQIRAHDMAKITRDLLDHFRILAEEAGVNLIADLPSSCIAEVDQIQMERLLSNLVSNALKFTDRGGEVRVSLKQGQDFLEISVEDTGRGIAAQHLPHIFDRFYRIPEADVVGKRGLGLGLNFVAWIAKAHGGKVTVKSEPNKGSRFVVTLPLKASPESLARGPAPAGM